MQSDGLLDLQVNGYAGIDFNDPDISAEGMDHALAAMQSHGVTACLPTLITATWEQLRERFQALDAAVSGSRLGPSMVPGYHLEGPFLLNDAGYHGVHPPEAMIDPDSSFVFALEAELSRPILLVTLAPERAGAIPFIEKLVAAGKTVAIGHSAAGFSQVRAATDAGLTLSTHLGNGLPQTLPKLENSLLAQIAEPRLGACLIADGHHMSPEALTALVHLKGADRCILVTDAVSAAGVPTGSYRFAGIQIERSPEGRVDNPNGVGLAGSGLQLYEAVCNLVRWGIADLDTALRMASVAPRAAIAYSLQRHGIALYPGKIDWNDTLQPTLIEPGRIA